MAKPFWTLLAASWLGGWMNRWEGGHGGCSAPAYEGCGPRPGCTSSWPPEDVWHAHHSPTPRCICPQQWTLSIHTATNVSAVCMEDPLCQLHAHPAHHTPSFFHLTVDYLAPGQMWGAGMPDGQGGHSPLVGHLESLERLGGTTPPGLRSWDTSRGK